jgi:hypothetical protein
LSGFCYNFRMLPKHLDLILLNRFMSFLHQQYESFFPSHYGTLSECTKTQFRNLSSGKMILLRVLQQDDGEYFASVLWKLKIEIAPALNQLFCVILDDQVILSRQPKADWGTQKKFEGRLIIFMEINTFFCIVYMNFFYLNLIKTHKISQKQYGQTTRRKAGSTL